MSQPGFTAAGSLYKSTIHYRSGGGWHARVAVPRHANVAVKRRRTRGHAASNYTATTAVLIQSTPPGLLPSLEKVAWGLQRLVSSQ
jgi:hypothetical protein